MLPSDDRLIRRPIPAAPTSAPEAQRRRRGPSTLARAILRRMLLIGLHPPRMAHEPAMATRGLANASLSSLSVRGRRGQQLATWLAVPSTASAQRPAPVVAAVHGWGVNASTLWPIVEPLTTAGIAVLLFDVACHGDSADEDFASLPRFAEDLAAAIAMLPDVPSIDATRLALIGHSVGAAATILHAAREGGVRALVSLSSFAHPEAVMQRWLREHHIPRHRIGKTIIDVVQETIGERFDRIAPEHLIAGITCPVLLVHGAGDRTVPLEDAYQLRTRLRHGELRVVDGDHDLRESLRPHAADIVAFLSTHLMQRAP